MAIFFTGIYGAAEIEYRNLTNGQTLIREVWDVGSELEILGPYPEAEIHALCEEIFILDPLEAVIRATVFHETFVPAQKALAAIIRDTNEGYLESRLFAWAVQYGVRQDY